MSPSPCWGGAEISREVSAGGGVEGVSVLGRQCWQPCSACSGAQPVEVRCHSWSWPVEQVWMGLRGSHLTHLIDVAQADVQGGLLAGVLLFTAARAGLTGKYSKAR